jgi:hypothetical protein
MNEQRSIGQRLGFAAIGVGLLAVGALGVACGGSDKPASNNDASNGGGVSHNAANVSQQTAAAGDFQSHFNVLMAEHVALACSATNAALAGNNNGFTAAAGSLDANSIELGKQIGAAYGPTAEQAFLEGWRRHIGFFVDYTKASAAKDETAKAKAKADLHQYAIDLATLLNAANGLPKDAVISLVDEHVATLTATIDAQAAGDQKKAYEAQRISLAFMKKIADPIAQATVKKFPDLFAGAPPAP